MDCLDEEYKVRYSETDCNGRLKLKSFLDYAQEIAGEHAEALGVGVAKLREAHRAWLLSRVKIQISAYPAVGNIVTVRTYPQGFDRLFARREFRFLDSARNCIAQASSLWLLVDMSAARILPAQQEAGALMPDNSGLPIAFPALGKITPDEGQETLLQCTVRDTQIDLNGHLNNAEYAGLVQDALGMGRYPREFQINYQKAIPPRSPLAITGEISGDGFILTGRVAGAISFECAGTLMAPRP